MIKLNSKEVKQLLIVENKKKVVTTLIDSAINELTYIRANEREWWKTIVDKYHLDKNKYHYIWIDGEIMEERRISKHGRKIF